MVYITFNTQGVMSSEQFAMYPIDQPKNNEVKVEWDKSERQKARNRINQRNYRRRKSEQQKENLRRREQSASKSPGSLSVSDVDSHNDDVGSSSHSRIDGQNSTYSPSILPWSKDTTSNHLPAVSTLPSQHRFVNVTSNNRLTPPWASVRTSSGTSPSAGTDQHNSSQEWQQTDLVGKQLALTSMPQLIPDNAWSSDAHGISPFPSFSNIASSSPGRGKTTLHLAAQNGQSQSVRSLLRHGADPNFKDLEGNTALHLATVNSHTEVIAQLIGAGVELDAVDAAGRTALHIGVENNNLEVIEQLLGAGSDPNIQLS